MFNQCYKLAVRNSLKISSIPKIAIPIRLHSARSFKCNVLNENKLFNTGMKSTNIKTVKALLTTHHKVGLREFIVKILGFDHDRLVKINPILARTSVVNVSARASSAPVPR